MGETYCVETAHDSSNLRNNVEAAMEWLLNHSDDPDIDVPLTPMQALSWKGLFMMNVNVSTVLAAMIRHLKDVVRDNVAY